MENKELEAVTFNDIDYAILDEIDNFIYTVNVNNANDIKIFKTKIEEDNEILEELSEEEQNLRIKLEDEVFKNKKGFVDVNVSAILDKSQIGSGNITLEPVTPE